MEILTDQTIKIHQEFPYKESYLTINGVKFQLPGEIRIYQIREIFQQISKLECPFSSIDNITNWDKKKNFVLELLNKQFRELDRVLQITKETYTVSYLTDLFGQRHSYKEE